LALRVAFGARRWLQHPIDLRRQFSLLAYYRGHPLKALAIFSPLGGGTKSQGHDSFSAPFLEVSMNKPYFIRAEWDEEAHVWVASSDDVPGLATEEETMEGLIKKLKVMIPELLEANGIQGGQGFPFELFTRRFEVA
jgi:predicted RNase H-like HicB family nuclease